MTGLSLRLWHDGRLVPVEGGGAQVERLRAAVSGFECQQRPLGFLWLLLGMKIASERETNR